jgi:hypothetical protein
MNNHNKIFFIGKENNLKTYIAKLLSSKFNSNNSYESTVGIDYFTFFFEDNNINYKYLIMDTGPIERYYTIINSFFDNNSVIFYFIKYGDFDELKYFQNLIENNYFNGIIPKIIISYNEIIEYDNKFFFDDINFDIFFILKKNPEIDVYIKNLIFKNIKYNDVEYLPIPYYKKNNKKNCSIL